ncbi:MAG TPA: TonB family protein [Pyrinomonadaceae bacterium]
MNPKPPCYNAPDQGQVFKHLSLFVLLLLTSVISVAAQSATADWTMLSPEGEEFSISMPKGSTSETGEQTYHKMILKTRLYLSGPKSGPVLAVASISGIKSNPALYTEFQRVNSYVDAFKEWFPEKIGRKTVIPKLSLVSSKTLNGNDGREYTFTIGDLSGTLEVYATRKRFYAITVLNTKKDDDLQQRFLSSFVLPEKRIEPAANVAQQPLNEAPPVVTPPPQTGVQGAGGQKNDLSNPEAANNEQKPAENADGQNAQSAQKRAPINGGVLNGKALYLPRPEYPAEAYSAKVSGTVVVQVTVDEQGGVISAHAVSGHPLLQAACVAAARQARFTPTTLMGEPVKVNGIITYNFVQ